MLNTKKIVLSIICVVVLTVGIFGVRYIISVEKYKETIKQIKIGTVDLSKIPNGTYTGSFDAVYIAAKVSVAVKDNKITNITLLSHKNQRGKPAEVIPLKVVKAQSLQVDTISGATNSSKVILESIENALESAKS
jgi:uncharacterized protein with FMN-binding domain